MDLPRAPHHAAGGHCLATPICDAMKSGSLPALVSRGETRGVITTETRRLSDDTLRGCGPASAPTMIVVLDGDGTWLWTHRIDNSPITLRLEIEEAGPSPEVVREATWGCRRVVGEGSTPSPTIVQGRGARLTTTWVAVEPGSLPWPRCLSHRSPAAGHRRCR